MTTRILKLEASSIQSICVTCNVNKQARRRKGVYRAQCQGCHSKRYGMVFGNKKARHLRSTNKGMICCRCGFQAEHTCQLDVDHINGNHSDDRPENLQTLCANCHRLKTHLNGENKLVHLRPTQPR